ncbi:hypothetical protein XENOCAPTIV_004394, partial [Xenoophorus captivus]
VNVASPINTAPQPFPAAGTPPPPAQVEIAAPAAVLDLRRDTDSPGTIRPFPSITEFIEDPCGKLGTPERIPSPPKAPIIDLQNPQSTNVLRPPSSSPLESEVEEEPENTRLVSIEEFLRQDQEPTCSRQPSYGRGLVEPHSDYHADNSRSDLSDILEEEEEELNSDHLGEAQARGYTVGANRRILKLPPQAPQPKQLFSIAEVTEEEDSSQEQRFLHHSKSRPGPIHPRDSKHIHHAPLHHPHPPNPYPHIPSQHHHFNRDPRSLTKEPSVRQEPLQARRKAHHRVHYADTVDNKNYSEDENTSFHESSTSRRVSACCPPKLTPTIKERALLKGLGDRLRREAMLRSQMALAAVESPDHGPTPPRPYPVSKTVRTLKSPVGRRMEIDVEYGTDNEEPVEYSHGEVVMEQMSSEWWVEGAQVDHCKPPHRRGLKAESVVNITAVDVIIVLFQPYPLPIAV